MIFETKKVILCSLGICVAGVVSWIALNDNCNEKQAYLSVQNEISKYLKSPSSAVYPKSPEAIKLTSDLICSYEIAGHFDSANSFGAMLRSTYKASTYLNEKGDWRVLLSSINGKLPGL